MATVVWHGFQSCSDHQKTVLPPPPPVTALRLKLAPQKPADLGGWRFLQSLSVNSDVTHPKPNDATGDRKKDGFESFDPQTLSPVKLSDKSLEMCTENLGCETGSDVINDGDTNIYPSFMSSSPSINSDGKSPTRQTRQQSVWGRKVNSAGRTFPPPLTTMRGSERVLVRSHREEGRLVMDAVKCPSSRSNFVSDRSHGRLRLSLLRTVETPVDSNESCQSLDLNIRENHSREEEEEEENTVDDESTGRLQRLQTISRCMEGEHEHHHHRHHRRHHHHQSKELMNIRLWVATS